MLAVGVHFGIYSAYPKITANHFLGVIFRTTISETTASLVISGMQLTIAHDYVFHLTCIMPIPCKTFQTSYILAINKSLKQ